MTPVVTPRLCRFSPPPPFSFSPPPRPTIHTINHLLLINKLGKIGFRPSSRNLIENYLTNRTQTTKANGRTSGTLPIPCGVPQGSVLGPLLFIIYINDLGFPLKHMHCQHYADDTVLYYSSNNLTVNVETTINSELKVVNTWCKSNKLSLNAKKTKVMQLGTDANIKSMQKVSLKIDNAPLTKAHTYRYLGITLDTNLNFKAHTKGLCRNVNYKVKLLRRVRRKLAEKSSAKVLTCMILPTIDYGDTLYNVTNLNILENLQYAFNRGLKTTYNKEEFHVEPCLQKCNVNKLDDRRTMHMNTAAFDFSSDENNLDIRDIRTRAHDERLVKIIRPKNPFYRKSYEFRVSSLWNSFNNEIRAYVDKEKFQRWNKKRFKDILHPPEI